MDMNSRTECFGCGDIDEMASPRISLKTLLNVVAALAVAFVIVYLETWAIEEAPTWQSAAVLEAVTMEGETSFNVGTDRNGGAESVLPDTTVPVAVLH